MSIWKSSNVLKPCKVNGSILDQAGRFQYLGCWIDSKQDPNLEIRSRIEQTRSDWKYQSAMFGQFFCMAPKHGDWRHLWAMRQRRSRCGHTVESFNFFGHHTQQMKKSCVRINDKYQYARLVIKEKIEGGRGIGKKKLSWMRNIWHWTGLNFEQFIRIAEDKQAFANHLDGDGWIRRSIFKYSVASKRVKYCLE